MENLNSLTSMELYSLRSAFRPIIFGQPTSQDEFIRLIEENIGILKYEYDSIHGIYSIKIRKTSIKKLPNFKAEGYFYYNIIGKIIAQMIINHRCELVSALMEMDDKVFSSTVGYRYSPEISKYEASYDLVHRLSQNPNNIISLISLQCIGDNIIQINT